jgi:hypothetical protein
MQARLVKDGRKNGESGVEGKEEGGLEDGAEGGAEGGAEVGGASHNPAVMNSISVGATLSPLPQNLIDLWQGTGGRKPARFFSFSERGLVKDKYHPPRFAGYGF